MAEDLQARILRAAERIAEAAEAQAGAPREAVRRRAEEVARAELTLIALVVIDELAGVELELGGLPGCGSRRCVVRPPVPPVPAFAPPCRCAPGIVADAFRSAIRRRFR